MNHLSLFHKQDQEEEEKKHEQRRLDMENNPPVEFQLTLFDGIVVTVVFTLYYFFLASHFAFHGEITSTGYLSHFSSGVLKGWTDQEIKELALVIANKHRLDLVTEREKTMRKAARKSKTAAKRGKKKTTASQEDNPYGTIRG